MQSFWLMTLAIAAPVLGGALTLFLPRRMIGLRLLLALSGFVAALVCLGVNWSSHGLADPVQVGRSAETSWIPYVHLNFSYLADGLGMFFALLVAGVGAMIVLYARGYFGKDADSLYRFYPTLGFFATAMIGIVLSDNMLLTVLFWEMTSISSFLLIGWDRDDKHAVKLAMQAFFTTGLGGMAMFGGVLLFGQVTQTMNLSVDGAAGVWRWSHLLSLSQAEWSSLFANGQVIAAFCLIFAGAATKSAQWPFHYWLPGAMAAPTPVSAYLHSATMVKAGVFLTGRMFPVFSQMEIWPWIVAPLGALTMVYGAVVALNQHDLKRIFAYTTVSQLGLLMCMWGLGALTYVAGEHGGAAIANLDWSISQIANHAFYKAPLFIVAGALGHYVSRDITQLNGVFKKHKAMVLTMLLAGYGLAAGPGTISFQAKELFLEAVIHAKHAIGGWWMLLMALTIITATCNVAIFVRLFTTLLGLPGGMKPKAGAHHDHAHHHEHEHGLMSHLIWLPGLLIVSLQYVGGLFPSLWNHVFGPLEANMNYMNNAHFAHGLPSVAEVFAHPGLPLYLSAGAIVLGLLVGLSPIMRGAVTDVNDRIYPAMYSLFVEGGGKAFRVLQTGHLRHYLIFSLIALLIGMVGAFAMDWGAFTLPQESLSLFEFWPGVLIGLLTCATALLLPIVEQRVVRVLVLGSCGFSVVALYLVYQAPDLALTQLMFEIISVILFVLVLRMLPKPDMKRRPNRLGRALIGSAVGLAIGWMTLVAATTPDDPKNQELGPYFVSHSYEGEADTAGRGGGGNNIVNVILVDFRGFDTMGEITVLGVAALGVWSLLPGRRKHKRMLEAAK